MGQARVLPDGARLALVGATHRRPHRFQWDQSGPWRLFTPPSAHAESVTLSGVSTPAAPAPEVLWFDLKRSPEHSGLDPLRQLHFTVTDEHECTVDLTDELTAYPAHGGDQLISLPLARFPRRCRRPTLYVFYWENGLHRPAAYEIANPAFTDRHTWRGGPVPQAQSTPEFNCVLSHFATGVLSRRSTGFSERGTVETEADFQTLPGAGAAERWQAIGMRAADESGNVFPHDDGSILADFRPGKTRLHFQGELFGEEPVWKLAVEFARTPESRFPPEERCTLRVPVSRASGAAMPVEPQVVDGARVRFAGLSRDPAGLLARFRMDGTGIGRTLTLLGATDEHGRPISAVPDLHRWTRLYTDGTTEYRVRLRDVRAARALNLAFAVQKTRSVEFTAAPARPNDPVN